MNRRLFLAGLEHTVRAAIYSALAVVLLGAATAKPPAKPLELRWRTATEQEEREYERQHLADVLNEVAQHP
ncbi:hypothetical protein [Micromonospora tarensis]|uniref:Uncharacterized protein n=1 Tax=Micromonospora tarensis TaxID=2806100 RepID=A0ABS1YD69_9ACTN|nr:hypothetical protein [Micromonospora tarensis]MBM0275363.1 hypothetical protein [Micromonospora tarensis]